MILCDDIYYDAYLLLQECFAIFYKHYFNMKNANIYNMRNYIDFDVDRNYTKVIIISDDNDNNEQLTESDDSDNNEHLTVRL